MARVKKTRAAPRTVHRSERIEVPASRPLRIVVIADTHSQPHPDSADLVAKQHPDVILHAGDVGNLEILSPFEDIAPLHVVRGNIDGRGVGLADSIDIEVHHEGQSLLTFLLMHIAVYGPKLRRDAVALASHYGASFVVCGHSHVPFIGLDRGLDMFNPGSIGPRRFQLPITFGVIEVAPGSVRAHHLSCETGERWSP